MHSGTAAGTPMVRPRGVWVILVGSTTVLLADVILSIAYFSLSSVVPVVAFHNLDRVRVTWWVGAAAVIFLGSFSTWTLFRMRTVTVQWWAATLLFAAAATLFNLAFGWGITVLKSSWWLLSVVGDVLVAMVLAYTLRLRADGMLHGPAQEARRSEEPPPLPVAAFATASVSIGLILAGTVAFLASQGLKLNVYEMVLGISSILLAVSGIGLWLRWKAARQLNAIAAALVGLCWLTNFLGVWAGMGLSVSCLSKRSVSAFFLGMAPTDPAAAEVRVPRGLKIFYWALTCFSLIAMLSLPLWR
jgi:hypothetical protein